MAAFSENLKRVHKQVNDSRLYHSSTPFAVDTVNNGETKNGNNVSGQKRLDGKRAYANEQFNIHGSPDMRNILAGRDISHNSSLSQKRMTRPKFEQMEHGTFEKNLLEAEMHRAHYDANRFAAGSKEYRRMKRGPGWAGASVSEKSQKDERIAASNPMYGKHHFFLNNGKKPEIRAGTDDMLRTLGWDHVANETRAGAPSAVSNKWRNDIHVPRGPAMTENSHILRPDRNPITGHNMGEEFLYLPGERRMNNDRKNGNIRYLERKGQETDTKERVFGHVMDMSASQQAIKRTDQQLDEGLRVGIAPYENNIQTETLFPNRNTMAVGSDRQQQRREYELNLAHLHEKNSASSQSTLEQNKQRNRGVWRVGM
jgi:hypothetical protein